MSRQQVQGAARISRTVLTRPDFDRSRGLVAGAPSLAEGGKAATSQPVRRRLFRVYSSHDHFFAVRVLTSWFF
jgi:hypothetical protein